MLNGQKDVLRDKDFNKGLPHARRINVVDKIIKNNSDFSQLYDDYEQMKDIYCLKQIEHYANLVLSENIEEAINQQVIERALQRQQGNISKTL